MINSETYKKELVRMFDSLRYRCKGFKNCFGVACKVCPLNDICHGNEVFMAADVVEAVEKWSKEHPDPDSYKETLTTFKERAFNVHIPAGVYLNISDLIKSLPDNYTCNSIVFYGFDVVLTITNSETKSTNNYNIPISMFFGKSFDNKEIFIKFIKETRC